MDPNANVTEQRRVAARIEEIVDNCSDDGAFTPEQLRDLAHEADRLAELVDALDTWLMRGGFLPREWADAGNWTRNEVGRASLKRIVAKTTDWANYYDRAAAVVPSTVAADMRELRTIAEAAQ